VIAFIPNDPVRDSTPTCAAQGPDGALYIARSTWWPTYSSSGPGQSHVYRVDPDTHESFLTAAHVWTSGLTTIDGCTFDREGNFWATRDVPAEQGGPSR
jgi:sugar lactone lactonase YvrE